MAAKTDATARALLEVTMLLMRSLAARMRRGEDRLAPAHAGMLARIAEGQCSISDLAEHQSVRLPTISRSVSLLVERGLVERWTPAENRRQVLVRLTPEGRRALTTMKRDAERATAAVLDRLSASERRQVQEALEILTAALAPQTTRRGPRR